VVKFFPLFETFDLFLQFLDKNLVFLFVVLDVAAESLEFGLVGVDVEFEFIQLLIFVVCNVVEYFALELFECLFDVLGGDLFGEGSLAFGDLPESFLLDFFGGVVEFADLLVGLHFQLL
jgi:hypothetical protein